MFRHTGKTIDLGEALEDLADDQSEWSQATFGTDAERGPIGAIKHLRLETDEAIESLRANEHRRNNDTDEEFADMMLLLLDAARRYGLTPMELLRVSHRKLQVNKSRKWPKPTDAETPVEHEE